MLTCRQVTPQCTVHDNIQVQSHEEAFYSKRTLPDSTEWTNVLRQHRQAQTQFTGSHRDEVIRNFRLFCQPPRIDPGFPPTLTSLYRDPAHPITPPGTTPLDSVVWKWKRISDFFSHNAYDRWFVRFVVIMSCCSYVEVSILDDDKKLVCGIAMKSQAEAETMIETIRQSGQSVDARFLLRATDTVSAALHKKRADHFLNLTKALIESMQEYVDNGVTKFDLLWQKSLVEAHKPLVFAGVVVDDYIPCGHNGKPVFASFTGSISRFEIWSMLVEKAYAKLYGGYDVIVGGQDVFALQDLFGGLPSSFPYALQRGNLVGFINTGHHTTTMPLGLKSGHTYGLVKLVQVLAQGRLHTVVQLRNVWADVSDPASMAGGVPWARGGAEWKQCSLDQKQRAGYQLADDGTVWLDLPTVVASFSTVLESKNVYQFPSTVPSEIDTVPLFVHVISSAWKGLTCGGREAIHLNPQFQFTCAESTALLVHLEQPCRRVNMQADYPCYVSPVVVGHADVGHRKLDIAKDVIATGTFVSNRSCLVEVPLRSAGTIAIVPATYVPFETTFQLVVVSTLPLAIGFVSDHDIPVCCVCRHPLQGSYRTYTSSNGVAEHVCQGACADQYRSAHAPVCVECHERIEVVAGRFSGRLFALPDGTSCHAECMDSYRMRHAESCAHCHYAIVKIEGKRCPSRVNQHTLVFFALDDGKKVHAECMEAYQVSIAKPCRHCGLPIVKGGRFDGRFYQLAASEDQCWDAFQATSAPKCRHCHDPILKVESKFDGRFYDLNDGSGKVHFECWDAFRQQSL
ncbi:hypothetical protein DYB32_005654 [Aphanomyces invadans]|uniref:Calpain catalytic domain-containing protein n=1 Tax=Aphanomyces invadans TaxID=157072 RepID=A0A3R6VXK0_9STRA|nr:hypothetical protein DYB32_005654 [Aphanomyces invadans]